MAPALVTVAQAKDYIQNTNGISDARLQALINAISMAVLSKTDRGGWLPQSYTQVSDCCRDGVMLREWPVLSVEAVTLDGKSVSDATLRPLTTSKGDVQSMVTSTSFYNSDSPVAISYTAGYQYSEPMFVPVGGGPSAFVYPMGAFGMDRGVSYASGVPLVRVAPGAEALGKYSCDDLGIYKFAAADANAAVLATYGYIPADLANACMEWISDRLAYQDRVGYSSKSIGGQETVSYKVQSIPDYVKEVLQSYTNVVPVF